jgi:hypothetical protein
MGDLFSGEAPWPSRQLTHARDGREFYILRSVYALLSPLAGF